MDSANLTLPPIEPDMRQRSNSDSRVSRRFTKKSEIAARPLVLPKIQVEDYSAGKKAKQKFNPSEDIINEEDDFFSPLNLGRPRSSTCPSDLFRRKRERPPTPPPMCSGDQHKGSFAYAQRKTPRDKVTFQRHYLGCVSEDTREASDVNTASKIIEDLREPLVNMSIDKTESVSRNGKREEGGSPVSINVSAKSVSEHKTVSTFHGTAKLATQANCSQLKHSGDTLQSDRENCASSNCLKSNVGEGKSMTTVISKMTPLPH